MENVASVSSHAAKTACFVFSCHLQEQTSLSIIVMLLLITSVQSFEIECH